jgi:integrase
LTGLRISEAYNGHREGQYWMVPSGASKNKAAHRVWLSELALAQLEQQPWAPTNTVQCWITDNASGWTAHDLRRTFSTKMNDVPDAEDPQKGGLGIAPYIVEKMLNHTLPGVMAIYNHAEYLPERQRALEAWSAWLRDLVGGQPADVISLRQASQAA